MVEGLRDIEMRQLQFKPKVLRRIAAPDDLQEFFRYVQSLIESGDNAAVVPSDDLIQNNDRCAYGGLIAEGTDRYAFTYFPGLGINTKWEIEVTADKIMSVAEGATTHLDLWACTIPGCGNLFSSLDETCFYHDYVDDERAKRERVLPELVASQSRTEWVQGYLRHFPNDHPMIIIGNYNSQQGLGERLGWFTTEEVERIIAATRQDTLQQPSLDLA